MQRLSGGKWKRVDRNILLSWMPDSLSSPLACGDSVCFYAKVSRPFSEKELTGFDYGDYLLRKGISGTALAYAETGAVRENLIRCLSCSGQRCVSKRW